MKILGITMGICSSAALFTDGKITASISEERFVKKKNYEGYPKHAVDFCLNFSGVSPDELDYIAFASSNVDPDYVITHSASNRTVADWIREMHEYWYPIFYGGQKRAYVDVFKDKIDFKQYPGNFEGFPFGSPDRIKFFTEFRKNIVVRHLKVPREKIVICEHHLSHAAYGLLGWPERRNNMLIFTADGFGDHSNASIRSFENDKFTLLYEADICNIGRLYRYITLLLGMKPGEDEYKVMGLAPYAKPLSYQRALDILEDTLYLDGVVFKYKTKPVDHYFWFREKFEGLRFDAIAGGLQKYVENLLVQWVKNAVNIYGISAVAFSGGVSLNVKANQEILRLGETTSLSVPGSGGDESLAMGAIFSVLLKRRVPLKEIEPVEHLYLGDKVSADEIENFIQKESLGAHYKITQITARDIAQLLAQGEIVGRFAGRMEFGQRALGNRSILANPSMPEVVKVINDIIKQRDFWMPFAPTILYEDCERYLYNPKNIYSPFMTIAFDTKPQAHKDLIAALHPADLTARPQMLKRSVNPDYYDIISEFKALTGIGGVLNTSFNLHGLPIVQSLPDILHLMKNSRLKYVALENLLLKKK
ncbi:MAG: carbamoyltransferase C-terminal domain-containing protein [Candidatus Omnitrophota bacterium]|nr:carbamoyltransferase C-terminal domain-containing protein [Candidatus Omnitrophota bacterium]